MKISYLRLFGIGRYCCLFLVLIVSHDKAQEKAWHDLKEKKQDKSWVWEHGRVPQLVAIIQISKCEKILQLGKKKNSPNTTVNAENSWKKTSPVVDLGSRMPWGRSERSVCEILIKIGVVDFCNDVKDYQRRQWGQHILTISPSPNIENLLLSCMLKTNCHLKWDIIKLRS